MLEHVFRLVCRTSLADCVAWEREGCAETRAVANNARYQFLFMCLLLSPPSSHCKTARIPTVAATAGAQLIPATSTAHPTSQPQLQPPSYQAQVNTTGKCERMCMHVCIKIKYRCMHSAWCHAWHVSKRNWRSNAISCNGMFDIVHERCAKFNTRRMARMGILYYTILTASITGNYTVYKAKQNKKEKQKTDSQLCRDVPQGGYGIMVLCYYNKCLTLCMSDPHIRR